jgi:hypothetical protein
VQWGFIANDQSSSGNHHSSGRTMKVARCSSHPSCGVVPEGLGWHQEEVRIDHHIHETKADIRD